MKVRSLGVLAAVAGMCWAASSTEAASLYLTDGVIATPIVVTDVANSGIVAYNGAVGAFQVVVSSGITKNAIGSPATPFGNLTVQATRVASGTPATLYVSFGEDSFTYGDGLVQALSANGLVGGGTFTYELYGNSANPVDGGGLTNTGAKVNAGTLLGSLALGGTSGIQNNVTTAGLGSNYALTSYLTLTDPTGGITYTTGATATYAPVVPLPAAAWAGFSMLSGLGVFGAVRRRRMA